MKKLFSLLFAIMILNICAATANCEIINIPMTPATKAYFAKSPDFGKQLLSEEYWKSTIAKMLVNRKTGYTLLPSHDDNSQPIVLKNTLSEKLYGQAHVYTLDHQKDFDKIILYIYGGAYTFSIADIQVRRCDDLSTDLNARVVIPLYNLAPQGNFLEAYSLLNDVYNDLIKLNKPVYIIGDSAGGGLSLGFVLNLKANGKKLPEKMVLVSPWVDITMKNPEAAKLETSDLMLSLYGLIESGKMWAGNTDRNDYRLSPINGDFKDVPPTMITVARDELFFPDIKLLYEKYQKNNQPCTLIEAEGLLHTFPLMSDSFPEAKQCYNMIVDFLK